MQTAILITGQASGNFTLQKAITSGNIAFSIQKSRFSDLIIYFHCKSDAKKALKDAKNYLIEQGNKPATAKTRGDFSYLKGEFINYDSSKAIIG
jgi:hypothetical protein